MHPPILERALDLFPETDFVNAYGLTETSSTVALLGPDDHRLALYSDEPLFTARLASVGQPVPGIEFRIVDDDGTDARPRRRPARSSSGATRSAATYVGTDSKVDADGWLHTGDRGWLDIEGYVFCEGRADDTIIRGGENIGPAEVEDALLQHDAISVGRRRRAHRRAVRRDASRPMISLRPGVDEIDLDHVRDWVRERIGSLKTPEIIEVVDEVPQTATGKILRREVSADPRGANSSPRSRGRSTLRCVAQVATVGRRRRRSMSSSRSGWPLSVPSRKSIVMSRSRARSGRRRAACTAARGSRSSVSNHRGAVRLSRSHSIEGW